MGGDWEMGWSFTMSTLLYYVMARQHDQTIGQIGGLVGLGEDSAPLTPTTV